MRLLSTTIEQDELFYLQNGYFKFAPHIDIVHKLSTLFYSVEEAKNARRNLVGGLTVANQISANFK